MAKSNKNTGKNKDKKRKKDIYLDYAASVSPNPSSIHARGIAAKTKLEEARKNIALILSAKPEEVIFTASGTESNNLAIQGMVLSAREYAFLRSSEKIPRPFEKHILLPHIITTNIEHPSVLETFKMLERRKLAEVSIVGVEENGIVDPKKIKKEIKPNTVLVSVMYANNEIGTIQPIKEIAKEIRHFNKINKKNKVFFHTDAVQAVNYLELNVEKLGVDMMSISGAKIEGAGRVGVLYKKKNVPLVNIFGGGDQEMGLRPGTENLNEIVKFSEAFVEMEKEKEKENKRLTKLRDYFMAQLLSIFYPRGSHSEGEGRSGKKLEEAKLLINGDLQNRLPNNVNITIPRIPSDLLVIELSAKGIMASSKSACKSSKAEGSYVIKAICSRNGHKLDPEIGGLRFSLGRDTKKEDIDYTIKSLAEILQKLEKWYD
jgi:cysteine desulfurase